MNAPTELDKQVEAYLAIREAVGLTNKGLPRLLGKFVAYAQTDGSPIHATTAVAWAWDNAPATCGVRGRSDRLMVVRGFLSYLATVVPGTEVPPSRIVAGAIRRRPYIFTEDEMAALINAAGRPNPRVPFRPTVLSTLLAILASTGLRVGEAVRMVTSNVRIGDAYPHLEILQTKFQKSRLVPIHRTVAVALGSYLDRRREYACKGWCDRLFVNRDGRPLDVHYFGRWFARLAQDLKIQSGDKHARLPCLTSFRHSFAIRRLLEWHKAGLDVQSLLPTLAVYLGHVGPESTYWYLTATPDLLRAAGVRFTLEAKQEGYNDRS